ncbi:LuxR family transcriptional regulator [Microbacterium sp. No. 7]|nr:LuxR family transcriptional regulator [Microbacterium sp. No. 7]
MRLRLLNDYEVIVAGLRAMIEPYADRLRVVEEDVRSTADRAVDLTLYDTFGAPQADQSEITAVLADPLAGAVVVYSWNTQPALVAGALGHGCRGYLDKRLAAAEVVDALERVGAGETVVQHLGAAEAGGPVPPATDWPGRPAGLSVREAEVIALITQGFTNADIAARAYISMNSLKTYIRSAYRKIGVERRSQAVRWGLEHGMSPRRPSEC